MNVASVSVGMEFKEEGLVEFAKARWPGLDLSLSIRRVSMTTLCP